MLSVLLIAPLLIPSLQHAPDPATPSLVLGGRVTDAATGEGVEDVMVLLPSQETGTETNEMGEFLLEVVPSEGIVDVEILHPCYHPVPVGVYLDPQVDSRRSELGLPWNHEKRLRSVPALGGCRRR